MKPRLIVQQKLTAFTNKYLIKDPTSDTDSQVLAYAQQKRLTFVEKITFYDTENKSNELFVLHAEKVLDVHGRYWVEDEKGTRLGILKKEFKKSLFNSTWKLMDPDENEVMVIKESSQKLALARRFLGVIPYVGGILEIVTDFLKYHFVFVDSDGKTVGMYRKTTLIRDHYTLSMTDDAYKQIDWRVFAAMGVALDALQSR